MKNTAWASYAFIGLILILVGVSLYVLSSYATAIVFGALLAYLAYPLYRVLNKSLNRPTVSALVITVALALVFTVPLFLLGQHLVGDLNDVYEQSRARLAQSEFFAPECGESESVVCRALAFVKPYVDQEQVRQYVGQAIAVLLNFLAQSLRTLILSLPLFAFNVVIMLLVLFYALRDGHEWLVGLKNALPLAARHTDKVFAYTNQALYAILYGQVITSMVQGALGGLGFWIFGVDNPLFWGLIMAFLSIFPLIGSWLVWIPATVGMFISGETGSAIGLGLYCLIFVSLSDNVLRPYIVAGKGDIHPLAVMLGVFGGLAAFGLTGFVLGPLVLALAITLARAYQHEMR